MGEGRCSHAVVREGLTGWVGGGAHMLGCGRGSHAGVGGCSNAGVGEELTCWGGGGARMLGCGRGSHAGVGEVLTYWGVEGDYRLEWFESDL